MPRFSPLGRTISPKNGEAGQAAAADDNLLAVGKSTCEFPLKSRRSTFRRKLHEIAQHDEVDLLPLDGIQQPLIESGVP